MVTRPPTFAAVVITLDEELHIRECLERLTWCDERIVVDMASEDRTREEAVGLATKVLLHERTPNFDAARNVGINAATSDWIIAIDADELVPESLARRLQAIVADAGDVAGIRIPRMNYCFGRPLPHVGGFPDYQLRCFRRDAGRYTPTLHAAPTVQGAVHFLPADDGVWIQHVRKNASVGDLVRKWDAYAETEARDRSRAGHRFSGPIAALWIAASAFRARFFTMHGYRDGMPGLVLSVMFAFYRFEVEAKLWEPVRDDHGWDAAVRRLRSIPHLGAALAAHGLRRLWKRKAGGA